MFNTASDDSEDVLKKIVDDGTFDDLRSKVVDALRKDEELKKIAVDMVENSSALAQADVQRANKRALFEPLRKELEHVLLEKASEAAWKVMCSPDSDVSKLIDEKVHAALCAVYDDRHASSAAATASQQHRLSAAAPALTYEAQRPIVPTHAWHGQQQQQQQQQYMQYGAYQYYQQGWPPQ